jgi:hypothetical protein
MSPRTSLLSLFAELRLGGVALPPQRVVDFDQLSALPR